MAFMITDETSAVVFNKMSLSNSHQNLPIYYLGSSAFMYLNWILYTWMGILLDSQLPSLTRFGLDIAMVLAFIGIVVPNLKLPNHWLCAITAAIGGVFTYQWPHQTGLLISSLFAIVVGVMAKNRLTAKSVNEYNPYE